MSAQEFLQALDALIAERHLLQHPFYQLWNEGALTLPVLREYAKEYYLHVHRFPTYLSATHSRCTDLELRQMLLENLLEEERGPDNHPELWIRFAEALGVPREELLTHSYLPQTRLAVELLYELACRAHPAEGLAALYAYESQFPEVAAVKLEGLRRYYGITDERGLAFFTVHIEADLLHRAVLREALAKVCGTPQEQERVLEAASEAADALNFLLDGIYQTYCLRPTAVV